MKIKIFILAAFVLISSDFSYAQSYVPLSPSSDLNCVYLPNGKTLIANKTDKGYKNTAFKSATKKSAKSLSKTRTKAKKVNQILKKLKSGQAKGAFDVQLKPKELDVLKQFFFDGKQPENLGLTLSEKIELLEQARDFYNAEGEYYKQLIQLIKKCKKKERPKAGSIETIYYRIKVSNYDAKGDNSGQGYVVVFAKVPAFVAQQPGFFCFQHPPTGRADYSKLSSNPCFSFTLSNLPGECSDLMERDGKGNPTYYYGELTKLNFYFKEREGAPRFEEAAKATEARIRANTSYGGWTDSARYAVAGIVDRCQSDIF